MTEAAPLPEQERNETKRRRYGGVVSLPDNKLTQRLAQWIRQRTERAQATEIAQPERPRIGDAERARRAKGVKYATGSVRLEGFSVSGFAQKLNERYINGEISLEEKGRLLFEHHGLKEYNL